MSSMLPIRHTAAALDRVGSGLAVSRRQRVDLQRQLTDIELNKVTHLAHLQAAEEVETAVIGSIGRISEAAQLGISRLNQNEAIISQLAPHGAYRLVAVGDAAAAAMCRVVADAERHLR